MLGRILIAEDSPTQAAYLQAILESEGYTVDHVSDGEAGLRQISAAPPDLILSDVAMPVMDGFEFCRIVKSTQATRSIPFVLLTQLDIPLNIARGLELGADDFIAKPFDEHYLLERIRQIQASPRRSFDGSEALLTRAGVLLSERERALRAARDFLEHLIDTSPGIVFTAEADTIRLIYVSPNIERVLGYTPADMVTQEDFAHRVVHRDDLPRLVHATRKLAESTADQVELEYRAQHRDGDYRWFYVTLSREDNRFEHGSRIIGYALDITSRKEAEAALQHLNETLERRVAERTAAAEERARLLALSEEQLRQTNELLQALIAASPLAILALNCDGLVRVWNPAAEEMFGWQASEILGKPLPTIPSTEQASFEALFQQVLQGGVVRGQQINRRRRDGTLLTLMAAGAPLCDAQQRPVGVVALLEDISERRRLEESLRHAQKMDAIGRLAGGVAHDFNNMLVVISGYSELLLHRLDLHDPMREAVLEIQKAGERSASLTRQLLAFSRKQVLELRPLSLNQIINSIETMLRRIIGEDIEFRTLLAPTLPSVRADVGQMEQLLLNLVVNARDAMPKGGTLTIETLSCEITPEARRTPSENGQYAVLRVRDTGCGISVEVQDRIFEPFFSTKGVGKGTGLGLATVYGIVQQSGGWIELESEVGVGTCFSIYLPAIEQHSIKETSTSPDKQGGSGGWETILLVEDEEMVRELARTVLQSRGYTILEATNPGEAMHLCQRYRGDIHLVLTDVVMPGMSGRDLVERLHTLRPKLKALYMSGYTDDAVLRHGVLYTRVAFIQKPFTPSGLSDKVRAVLDTPEDGDQ